MQASKTIKQETNNNEKKLYGKPLCLCLGDQPLITAGRRTDGIRDERTAQSERIGLVPLSRAGTGIKTGFTYPEVNCPRRKQIPTISTYTAVLHNDRCNLQSRKLEQVKQFLYFYAILPYLNDEIDKGIDKKSVQNIPEIEIVHVCCVCEIQKHNACKYKNSLQSPHTEWVAK